MMIFANRFVMGNAFDTNRLHQLSMQKLDLLRAARELSVQQLEALNTDQVEELMSILSRKSEIFDSLSTLQSELEPFRKQNPDERIWNSNDARSDCRATFQQIDRLLEELSQMDNLALKQMSSQRDAIACQIAQHTTAEAVQNAYAQAETFQNPMTDLDTFTGFSLEG